MNEKLIVQFFTLLYETLSKNLVKAITNHPNARWSDALSKGQVKSKIWLANELRPFLLNKRYNVHIHAGWYGVLAAILLEKYNIDLQIRSFDIDPSCEKIADDMNRSYVIDGWKFKSVTKDVLTLDYPNCVYEVVNSKKDVISICETPDIVINTSCEHFSDFDRYQKKLPKDKIFVLQSNNLVHEEHVNKVNSIEQFKSQVESTEILYEGSLEIEEANYTRFMLIGIK